MPFKSIWLALLPAFAFGSDKWECLSIEFSSRDAKPSDPYRVSEKDKLNEYYEKSGDLQVRMCVAKLSVKQSMEGLNCDETKEYEDFAVQEAKKHGEVLRERINHDLAMAQIYKRATDRLVTGFIEKSKGSLYSEHVEKVAVAMRDAADIESSTSNSQTEKDFAKKKINAYYDIYEQLKNSGTTSEVSEEKLADAMRSVRQFICQLHDTSDGLSKIGKAFSESVCRSVKDIVGKLRLALESVCMSSYPKSKIEIEYEESDEMDKFGTTTTFFKRHWHFNVPKEIVSLRFCIKRLGSKTFRCSDKPLLTCQHCRRTHGEKQIMTAANHFGSYVMVIATTDAGRFIRSKSYGTDVYAVVLIPLLLMLIIAGFLAGVYAFRRHKAKSYLTEEPPIEILSGAHQATASEPTAPPEIVPPREQYQAHQAVEPKPTAPPKQQLQEHDIQIV